MPEQLADVTDVNKVISQLLPTRKRKPRTKKPNTNGKKSHKISLNYENNCQFRDSQQKYLELMEMHQIIRLRKTDQNQQHQK